MWFLRNDQMPFSHIFVCPRCAFANQTPRNRCMIWRKETRIETSETAPNSRTICQSPSFWLARCFINCMTGNVSSRSSPVIQPFPNHTHYLWLRSAFIWTSLHYFEFHDVGTMKDFRTMCTASVPLLMTQLLPLSQTIITISTVWCRECAHWTCHKRDLAC